MPAGRAEGSCFYGENKQRNKKDGGIAIVEHTQGLGSLIAMSAGHLWGIYGGLPFPEGF